MTFIQILGLIVSFIVFCVGIIQWKAISKTDRKENLSFRIGSISYILASLFLTFMVIIGYIK
jgi:hypothetical protein